jgi:hypothetical protein
MAGLINAFCGKYVVECLCAHPPSLVQLIIKASTHEANWRDRRGPAPMAALQELQVERRCPWCNGSEIQLVQRGYTGPTDEVNQYYTCRNCGKVTYELIAKTAREMRLGRYHAGGIYKDSVHQTRYSVSRVLKVGLNEYLIYLKPLPGSETFPVASINP